MRGLAAAAVTCACSPVGAGLASAAAAVADVAATSPSSACDIGSLRAAAALADMASGLAAAATAVAEAGSPVASGLIQAATDVAVTAVKAQVIGNQSAALYYIFTVCTYVYIYVRVFNTSQEHHAWCIVWSQWPLSPQPSASETLALSSIIVATKICSLITMPIILGFANL